MRWKKKAVDPIEWARTVEVPTRVHRDVLIYMAEVCAQWRAAALSAWDFDYLAKKHGLNLYELSGIIEDLEMHGLLRHWSEGFSDIWAVKID